jgi:hypothetical protein
MMNQILLRNKKKKLFSRLLTNLFLFSKMILLKGMVLLESQLNPILSRELVVNNQRGKIPMLLMNKKTRKQKMPLLHLITLNCSICGS